MKKSARLFATVLALVIGLFGGTLSVPAHAATSAAVAPAIAGQPEKVSPRQLIKTAEANQGKSALNRRQKVLAKSKALTSLITMTIAKSKRATYLRFLAALSTDAQAKKLVKVTKGKHFVATVVGNTVTIKIVKGAGKSVIKRPGMVPMNAPACIEAYIAWYAWYAAVAALCGAVAVANPIAGLVCALAFGLFEFTLIDFNNACKNGSDV